MLRVGDLPTSKPLRQWLAGRPTRRRSRFDPEERWQDPDGVVETMPRRRPRADVGAPSPAGAADAGRGWRAWRAADEAAARAIDATLGDALSEPLVARPAGGDLPADATLLRRLVDAGPRRRDVLARARRAAARAGHRGANGIDGTVSAALGAAAAGAGPVVLLIGDVALAHDLGGLLGARRLGLSLTIVLLNNDGGGIFDFLPVARERDAFEEHVATPHGLDFARAAALYGCAYARADDPAALRTALDAAGDGVTLIEVRTDRDRERRVAPPRLGRGRRCAQRPLARARADGGRRSRRRCASRPSSGCRRRGCRCRSAGRPRT